MSMGKLWHSSTHIGTALHEKKFLVLIKQVGVGLYRVELGNHVPVLGSWCMAAAVGPQLLHVSGAAASSEGLDATTHRSLHQCSDLLSAR